jgi:hypothetical protein
MKRPDVKGYANNVLKELRDVGHSWNAANEMSNRVGPGTDTEANRLAGIADKEQGQLLGAVLQGRRYDSQGKQIKTAKAVVKSYKKLPAKGK